jgi:hypothetical protein
MNDFMVHWWCSGGQKTAINEELSRQSIPSQAAYFNIVMSCG